MKTIKQKYTGMKKPDLAKSLATIQKSMVTAKMTSQEDPKAFGTLRKLRYELALVKHLLSMPEAK